ncbi:MAG TPA: FliH/SctL family protein [Kofleriaceae bacterium]|nr:FliH/SctL family protein [Kofleriaceae bacterium]
MAKVDPKDIRPFMPLASTPTRPLGQALPAIETPEVTSPWLPKPVVVVEEAPPRPLGPTADEIAQFLDDARAQGHAEGLAETAALRAQLAALIERFTQATAQVVAPTSDAIIDIAVCVIDAWFGTMDRAAQLAPVIRAWLSQARDGEAPPPAATVRVAPGDVEPVRAAITEALAEADSDAKLDVVADAKLSPGAIAIASPGLELSHSWQARLPELRAAIVDAVLGTDDATDPADA